MKRVIPIYTVVVFLFLVLFFIVLHPIAILDTDDWTSIHHLRLPIPIIHAWNPIKVFPEVLMSVFSYLGAYIIYPITGRYCFSLSVSNGIFICIMITVYFLEFLLLMHEKYRLPITNSLLISIVFICLHFLIVVHAGSNNIFLFYAYDLNCVYHYTLSTIINASLVMHMIRFNGYQSYSSFSSHHRMIIVIWTYLAIFSNLYTNIIIAVYVGVELLFELVSSLQQKKRIDSGFFKKNTLHVIILLTWFSSLLIEKTGGNSLDRESDYIQSLKESFFGFFDWFSRFNALFVILVLSIIIIWIIKFHEKRSSYLIKYCTALFLTMLYIMLLCSVVDRTYINRIDVIFGTAFWFLLILMLLLGELTSQNNSIVALAMLATVSVTCTVYVHDTYKDINYCNIPYQNCEALTEDIIEQFHAAEKRGESELDLVVPKFDTDNNWPLGIAQSDDFSKALYRHHVTGYKINVRRLILSEEKTASYINSNY